MGSPRQSSPKSCGPTVLLSKSSAWKAGRPVRGGGSKTGLRTAISRYEDGSVRSSGSGACEVCRSSHPSIPRSITTHRDKPEGRLQPRTLLLLLRQFQRKPRRRPRRVAATSGGIGQGTSGKRRQFRIRLAAPCCCMASCQCLLRRHEQACDIFAKLLETERLPCPAHYGL